MPLKLFSEEKKDDGTEEHAQLLQGILVGFLAPASGGSQPPVTLLPGHLIPLASVGTYTQMHARTTHARTYTHTHSLCRIIQFSLFGST